MTFNEEKHRRMEIRKATGSRVVSPPESPALHRGPEYLVAHACFICRKSYKRRVNNVDIKHHCPECNNEMYAMGRSFKAPKTSDLKQWKKVQLLYAEGFRFVGSGYHEGENLPKSLSEVDAFLRRNLDHPLKIAAPNKLLKNDSLKP